MEQDQQINAISDKAVRNEKLALFVVYFAFFLDIFSFGLIIPVIPFIITEIDTAKYGGEGVVLAWIVSIFSLAQLVAAPIWGKLSDVIGRRPVILFGLIGSSISFALIVLFLNVPGIFIARLLQGIFTGATLPTVRAYIADVSSSDTVTQRYGILGSIYGLGYALGPSVGGFTTNIKLPGVNYLVIPMILASCLALMNFIIAFFVLPESFPKIKRALKPHISVQARDNFRNRFNEYIDILKIPTIFALFIAFIAMNFMTSGFEAIFPLAIITTFKFLTPTFIGVLFLVIGIFVGLVQIFLVSKISKIIGEEHALAVGFALIALGTVTISFVSTLIIPLLGVLLIAVGMGFSFPTVISSTTNRLPADKQGIGAGLNEGLGGVGRVIGPLLAGYLFEATSFSVTFRIAAIFMTLITFYTFVKIKPLSKEKKVENYSDNLTFPEFN